ncbi:MAG: Preprotein translocase subunit SecG, partial [Candidatus Acidoferrum typicum]|nr:Preprotein translocase subunit SecG [Candidatus Acidoferrum typicum]
GVAPKGVGVQVPPSAPCSGALAPKRLVPAKVSAFMLTTLIYIVHIFVSFFLIIVVLLQSGKSGDIAAAFGGQGSQTAFGPRGAATILTKATTWCAIIFMLTSITLSIAASHKTGPKSVLTDYKSTPAAPAKPGNSPAPKK